MKLVLYLLPFLLFYGCATKYILPSNRFITPETQGGALKGSIEIHRSNANSLKIVDTTGQPDSGVEYESQGRTGFLFSGSLFEPFDLIWSHTGGAPSMFGGKFQILGDPRAAKSEGHKLSAAALFGGNEHEDEDGIMDFDLSGHEFIALYGYRINESVLPYVSLGYSVYKFSGDIHKGALGGTQPKFDSKILAWAGGIELSYDLLFIKIEYVRQNIKTTQTEQKTQTTSGFSFGVSW